jgi:hypothetical protein
LGQCGQTTIACGNHFGLACPIDTDLIPATASSTASAAGPGYNSSAGNSMPFDRNRTSKSSGGHIVLDNLSSRVPVPKVQPLRDHVKYMCNNRVVRRPREFDSAIVQHLAQL